jgi:hypothetical protein
MGYRYVMPNERDDDYSFRMMEVVMVEKKGHGKESSTSKVMIVDNHWDTLRYVQEHMNDFVGNMIKVNKMAKDNSGRIEESAKLFEKNLQPLFSLISETSRTHILDKLSNSLKKALILMAMDRYKSDTESICKALGITQDKLEKEMTLCGLNKHRQAA